MPELAEAGYTSIWLPPPTKGSGGLSVGYDMWDPFDFGQKDQRNTVRTRYGTEAELLQMMEVAHRFGIRVYFDNIMNHRSFDIPGFNETTPTGGEGQAETYPGMVPEDFHLQKTEDGFYRKWNNTRDWNSAWQVQNLGLADLIDIAQESGNNLNFGTSEGSTHPKYGFVRDLNRPEQYDFDKDGNRQYFGWLIDRAKASLPPTATTEQLRDHAKAYILANRLAYVEYVEKYLERAVRWKIDRLKADGLRLDAVKHVPDYFFGNQDSAINSLTGLPFKDTSNDGYLGQVQWQFNRTRGFSDANHRDSIFNDKRGRDDAMVFGEHLGQPPGYNGYWDAGMRLVDNDLRSKLNSQLGNPWGTLAGLDSPGAGGFSASLGVTHANSHDSDYAAQKELQHAHYMFREGIGLIYSDGYYKAATLGESGGAFPRHANTQFLGQFGDPRIPNILKLHNDFARGLQQGRWSDGDYMAYERRDNRNKFGDTRNGTASEEITMVAMFNDNTAQGQARPISTSFWSGAYLYQYAEGPNGSFMGGFYKYAGELGSVVVPPGGYYVFGWRTPEFSTLWPSAAVTLFQTNSRNGQVEEVPRITVTRKDGPDGDKNFNPYNLDNRGYPVGVTPPDYTYQTTVPVVKSGNFTIIARADGSAENIVLKLDGGVDLNGTRPVGNTDPAFRDHPPGIFSDVWMGYEQPLFVERQFAEKFAAQNTVRCQIGSPGAETYVRTISGGGTINNGPAAANNYGTDGGNQASFVYHDPAVAVAGTAPQPLQFDESGANIVIWAESNAVGSGFKAFVYYTVDGSFPEGAGGIGRGTTRVAEMNYQRSVAGKDWWASIGITKPAPGTTLTYKIGFYKTVVASQWPSGPTEVARKKNMLTTFRVQDFNPETIVFFPHNDYARVPTLNTAYTSWPLATQTGLSEGFHVLRARAHLNRNPDTTAPLYQTFTQVFYYDATTPTGEVLFPANNGDTVGGSSYELVVQTDKTVEDVWFHIADSDDGNDDSATKILNGNGPGFEPFVDANQNGTRESDEEYTDINANGQYDDTLTQSWGQATQVTSVNLTDKKEWRFRYNNIPSKNTAPATAAITIRLIEASSVRDIDITDDDAHVTEIVRNVNTDGPDQRVNIAWPQRDGDRVDDNYTMKVYFTKSLADGTDLASLKQRFTFSIDSSDNNNNTDAVVQSRDNFTINYNVNDTFHELAIPLPNMYNDVADFLHTLKVTYTFPDNRKLDAIRLVKANPSTKPFVRITRPTELGSDGRQTEIILPDVSNTQAPGDVLDYIVRVETSAAVTDLVLSGTPSINFFTETFTDTNGNGKWDAQEPSTDKNNNGLLDPAEPSTDRDNDGQLDPGETFTDLAPTNGTCDGPQELFSDTNGNGIWDPAETFTDLAPTNGTYDGPQELFSDTNGNGVRDPAEPFIEGNGNGVWDGIKVSTSGNTKTWDFTWRITAPGTYVLKATATLGSQSTETVRNARVILRQITGTDSDSSNDDDEDGLVDIDETNKKDLPEANAETWSNGDVHINRASGLTLPNSPDSDGDLLPDALEVGWRLANTNVTDVNADTNGDSFKNFIADLDPPFYAVVANNGKVPGVGSLNQGDDRARQAAGTVTDPANPDTDNDGIPDGVEDANRNGWVDGDGQSIDPTWEPWLARKWPNNVIDAGETWTETSPTKADSDGDNLQDGFGEDKNFNGVIDGDTNTNRVYNVGEQWSETDPLKFDTDGDGLPDGWENQYGLDPLDNGTLSMRTGGAGNPNNGALGDPDGDGFTNAQELSSGTHPTQQDVIGGGEGEGSIQIGTFTQWRHTDLLVLDEYNESNSNGAADVYRSNNDTDTSRDILAFSFRDGGDLPSGDGRVYFRIDFMDLAPNAWQSEVDAYIVIDTGNPGAGERSIPNEVDIATDMKWEAVIAVYGQNFGNIFVDRNAALNTTTQTQNPVTAGGVEARSFGGRNEAAWSSRYDAVEIAVERQQLKDAGWLGDPNTLNFQVFTTKPNTQNAGLLGAGSGDLGGRNDIRDTIYDDKLASDWWRDQDDIILNGKLSGYFGRSGSNDRNKNAKVVMVAHGNQAIQPASVTQALILSGTGTSATGYHRLIKSHEDHGVPLTLHITPTLASSIQWAVNPINGAANDGPSLNQRIKNLVAANQIDLVGSTFADHVPKYFTDSFNIANKQISDEFLTSIYGSVSSNVFWAPERVLDDESLAAIYNMGYRYVFADQMRHFVKWFGRSAALSTSGYRINEVNSMKVIPIHDETSEYLDQARDEGSAMSLRQLLSRRARSGVQDQAAVLWRDMGDFGTLAKADSYDANVRWLGSRPWIRVVTAQQIADSQVNYVGQNGTPYNQWGTELRGTGQNLEQTAKDYVDWATRENYDNWFNKLSSQNLGASSAFGRVGTSGHANAAWNAISALPSGNVQKMARAVIGGAMFQTAFHLPSATTDLRKFSTGDYINQANNTETMADFARNTQAQTRFAKIYERVNSWNNSATMATLGTERADVDLDGQDEYLLFNSRVFAVFEGKGGRMTAAWIRHHSTKQVWQVAGNFAAYSNTDTEDEGATNVTGLAVNAYRTSGFKDWWTVTGTSGSSASVNAAYAVTDAPLGGTGWKFIQGGISKTITLPNTWSGNLSAEYTLSGPSKLYVRFGLSPNLLDLMINGQNNLVPEQSVALGTGSRLNLLNNGGTLLTSSDDIRAFLIAPQINGAASDKDQAGFTTVTRRNQAQTHQVEVELTGSGPHIVTVGFDQGTDFTEPMDFDSDLDGIPDAWERTYNSGDIVSMTQNTDGDGDGLLDIEEYVMGSNPNDASSGPMQPQTSKTEEGFQVSFRTIAGRVYTVKFRDNLGLAAVPLTTEKLITGQTNPIYGDGTTKSVTDITAGAVSRRFYEVEVSLPPPSP